MPESTDINAATNLIIDFDFDLSPEAKPRGGTGRKSQFPQIASLAVGKFLLFPGDTEATIRRAAQIVEKNHAYVDGERVHKGKLIPKRVKTVSFTVSLLSDAQKAKIPQPVLKALFPASESLQAALAEPIVGIWRTA